MRGDAVLCALLVIVPGARALAQKPFEQILPAGTTLLLSLKSFRDVEQSFRATGYADLWNDPEMRPFVKGFDELLERSMADMKRELGFTLLDLKELCQGEIAIAFGDPAALDLKKSDLPLALLIDTGDRKEKATELIRRGVDLSKRRKRETEFRGHTIVTLEDPDKDKQDKQKKDEEPPPEVSFVQAEGLLALGLSKSFLQDIIACRTDPEMKALDDQEDFKFLRERHGNGAWSFGYFHLGRWLESLPRLIQATGEGAAVPMSGLITRVFSDALGLGSFRAVSWASFHGDAREQLTFFALQSGPPRGLVRFLSMKPEAMRFPAMIPPDAREAYILAVDWNGLLAAVEDTLKMARPFLPMPPGEAGEESLLAQAEKEIGIRFKEDLIGPLGNRLVIFNKAPRGSGSPHYTVFMDVKDKERLDGTLRKLFANAPLATREYLGHTVWSPPGTGAPDPDGGDAGAGTDDAVALCLADAHFVIGAPPLVEEFVRREGKEIESVNDAPGLKALASRIPATTTVLGYTSPESIEDLFTEMRAKLGAAGISRDDDDEDDDDGDGGRRPGEKRTGAGGIDAYFEKLGEELVALLGKLPQGKGLGRHVAGTLTYSFIEEKGIGVIQVMETRRAPAAR